MIIQNDYAMLNCACVRILRLCFTYIVLTPSTVNDPLSLCFVLDVIAESTVCFVLTHVDNFPPQ